MKKVFKTMFIVSFVILFIFVAFVLVSAFSAEKPSKESVAIIGGADGPTAIFITGTLVFDSPLFCIMGIVLILFVVSAIGWLVTRKR